MKKFFTFLALCLLTMGTVATAKNYYTLKGLSAAEDYPAVSEIQAGVDYFIGNPRMNAVTYVSPTGLAKQLSDDCIYQFEVVGTDAQGATTYLIKNKATGEYLDGQGFTSYTTGKTRAWTVTILPAQVFNAVQGEDSKWSVDWDAQENVDPRTATVDYDTNANYVLNEVFADGSHVCFVIREADNNNEDRYLLSYGGLYSYRDTNCWAIYEPEIIHGYAAMEPAFQDILNGEEFDGTSCPIGSGPGQFSQEAVDRMQNAYDTFMSLYNEGGDDDACDAAIAELQAAKEALDASMGKLEAGQYYRFWNWRNDGAYTACMYDDGTNVRWTANYSAPEELDVDGTKYIWTLVEIEGKYYFQNYYTGRYMADQNSFSVAFPTTVEPTTSFTIENGALSGTFNIYGDSHAGENCSMHTQVNGYSVVYWYAGDSAGNNAGSLWKVETMDPEVIKAMEEQIKQNRLNSELKELLAKANNLYNSAFSYDEYATDVEQFSFNRTETTEGAEANICDGDYNTYYHSFWSEQGDLGQPHWFQVETEEPVSEFAFDVVRRGINTNKNGAVTRWAVVGTNDETLAAEDDYMSGDIASTLLNYQDTWEEYQVVNVEYNQSVLYNNATYTNAKATGEVKFSTPCKYVRFLALVRMGDTITNDTISTDPVVFVENISYGDLGGSDNVYMCVGEFDMRSLTTNPDKSVINAIPQEVRDALTNTMATAEGELADELATQETIDALQKAYDAFYENFPEPQRVTDRIAELQQWVENAPMGEELGCFPESAVTELGADVEEVAGNVKEIMSMEEINDALKTLNDAFDKFIATCVMPEPGMVYVQSLSANEQTNSNYIIQYTSGETQTNWGGAGDGDLSVRPGYYWNLIKNEDNTWSLYNYGTGTWLGAQVENDEQVTASKAKANFTLRPACVEGGFNVVFADGVYLNMQPGYYNMVTWGEAFGDDNSAFTFIDAEEEFDGQYTIDYTPGTPQIITLPFAVKANSDQPLLKLAGVYMNNYQFTNYEETDVIEAGTPFLYYTNDDTYTTDLVDLVDEDIKAIQYATGTHNQGAMCGTLDPIEELEPGYGIFFRNKIVGSEEGDGVDANTGFFCRAEAVDYEGDVSIPVDLNSVTQTLDGISQIITKADRQMGTFDLQGRRIEKAVKGLYIINGKKVLVK